MPKRIVQNATFIAQVHSNDSFSSGHLAIIVIPYSGVKGATLRKKEGNREV